jgi:hypothetical protein
MKQCSSLENPEANNLQSALEPKRKKEIEKERKSE